MATNMIDTPTQARKRLRRAVRRLVRAELDNSWSGSLPVEDCAQIRKELQLASKNINKLIGQMP